MYYGELENTISELIAGTAITVLSELSKDSEKFLVKADIEIPKERSHGDLSSNAALKMSKAAGRSPMDLAGLIKIKLDEAIRSGSLKDVIEKIEIKNPGFINFFVRREYLGGILRLIRARGGDYGRSDHGKGYKLQIEFVSANPTGPLTIAHGRQAALGDSLANIMKFLGYDVTREYYLNDEGTQMNILGNSIRVRYAALCGVSEEIPQDFYKGAYVTDIAKDFLTRHGDKYANTKDIELFRQFGLEWILSDIRKDLNDFGVKFDVWYSQCELRKSGKIEKAIEFLDKNGFIFDNEGAKWFRSSALGDDKDRVIIKSDGSMTYLTPDIAYHREKYARGFSKIIDIWGPDHHGYIPRMKAAIKALGFNEDSLSVLIVQLATLYRAGQVVSMSTRAGEFITLREVMDEVGKDVARFCFIMRKMSSHLDFDMDMVKKESSENPVFYIQYAHARIWSILDFGKDHMDGNADFDPSVLKEKEEIDMMRMLRQFPMVVGIAGTTLEPYAVMQYLQDLAGAFHSFYNKHRVVGDDETVTRSRIALVDCVRIVLANGLGLLGVSMPKKM